MVATASAFCCDVVSRPHKAYTENTCVIEFPINHRAASMLITAWESTCRCLCEMGSYFHQVQNHQLFGYHRYLILFRERRGGCQAPDPRAALVMGRP